MQILTPPSTSTYSDSEGHHIKTFLISTKPNEANWQISKETGHQLVKTFIGKPFVIVPEELSDHKQIGHVDTDQTRDQLVEEYKKYTHGIIESISSPYFYGDGTDDYFYMANVKLNNSLAASALIEHGNTWNTFAVSPHIVPYSGPRHNVVDWEGISLSLVRKGAYGKDAVVTKYCKGDKVSCDKSLAAGEFCNKSDSLAASMISSLLSQTENNPILAQVLEQPNPIQQPITKVEEPKKEDNTELIESLKKQLETAENKAKEKDDLVTKLVNKDKTNTLNGIFKTVQDETVRESLIKDYISADTDLLDKFVQDYQKHVVPSLIEEAKAAAEAALKNRTVEESKKKSLAASLPKEPEIPTESIVPNKVNEVKRFDRLMRGFQ